MKEEFKSIGCGYHVSNKGRVFKYIHGKRFFLAQTPDAGGYYKVKLRLADGKQKTSLYIDLLLWLSSINRRIKSTLITRTAILKIIALTI